MEHRNASVMAQQQQDRVSTEAEELENAIQCKLDEATKQIVLAKVATVIIPQVPLNPGEREEFEPRIISIGPYYWGNQQLRSMDDQKRHYVAAILERNRAWTLKDYLNRLQELEDSVRTCYVDVSDLGRQEFVEMMLLDGCFIVEYFLRVSSGTVDELITSNYIRPMIEHDMLLLQNQLPFFVVQSIFDLAKDQNNPSSALPKDILKFFNRSSFIQKTPFINIPASLHSEHVQHLLHLYHSFIISTQELHVSKFNNHPLIFPKILHSSNFHFSSSSKKQSSETDILPEDVLSIPSAAVLASAGVKFKKKKKGSGLLSVSFHQGVMEIPSLLIDGFTKSLIKNLIAFEKFNPYVEPQFTAYVKFLDHIINNSEDVALLHKMRIIDHALGSDEEVARLFNGIGGSTFHHQPIFLKRVYKDVDKYCKVKRHKWQASLMRNYFNSPWSFFKLAAAVVLLILAFLQTFFAVYSYFHPHS